MDYHVRTAVSVAGIDEMTTIGLVNQSATVNDAQLAAVAAALQIQVRRDLKPIWSVDADVLPLGRIGTVPAGVSPLFVVDETPHGFAGVHTITQGVAWAMVSTKRDWMLAASHELIEMLVDPTGEQTRNARGLILADGILRETDERFDYLLEACDPIEDQDHAYTIGEILVSDFYTPSFFDDVPTTSACYSFNGALSAPRTLGMNGYLSWRDPATHRLRQLRRFGSYSIVDLPDRQATQSAAQSADADRPELSRRYVDRNTPTPRTHPELYSTAP